MFELKLSEKTAHIRAEKVAPDERALIERFVAAHNFDGSELESAATRVSHFKFGRMHVQAMMSDKQTLAAQPVCVVKAWNSTYSHLEFDDAQLYMMGVFFSAVRRDKAGLSMSQHPPMTFSDLRTAIGQQDDILEGGVTPVHGKQSWMKKPVAGYFATGRTISTMMDQAQRNLLFGGPAGMD